ncbi:MAG: diphosphomevalonate decarboxylase [Bacteroidales bacterium]
MNYKETYLQNANTLKITESFSGVRHCKWQSPSNIALIKYWGKKDGQIPLNASLSFTLKNAHTITEVTYSFAEHKRGIIDFNFEGKPNDMFAGRIKSYVSSMTQYLPFLNQLQLEINSSNSFPHSSGIASSASSMSALALCFCDMEKSLFGTLQQENEFYQKASFLARIGSGSAARSVYGGFVGWGINELVENSSDEVAMKLDIDSGNRLANLKDAILITSKTKKKVSSSHGHQLMNEHPYRLARRKQADQNFIALLNAIETENDTDFIRIVEHEALSLHALMLSSVPGFTLMNENSWEIINKIRKFRESTGIMITFTLDAGPNVHIIYKQIDSKNVESFIANELLQYCENGYWISDETGEGPKKLN